MKRLGIKVLAIILIISLGGLVLTSFFINYAINKNFRSYLNEKRRFSDQQIIEVIEKNYQETTSWSSLLPLLRNLDLASGIGIRIENTNGQIVYDSFRMGMMSQMSEMPFGRRQGMMRWHYNNNGWEGNKNMRTYPLQVEGRKIGTIYINSPNQAGLLSAQDEYFKNSVNKGILIAAGIIAALTIIISYYFSRRITSPLVEISKATGKIAEGDLSQRVRVTGGDELGKLARSFNEMARKLEQLEKIRKESTMNLTHELRTPLSTMRSYLEAMEDGVIPASKENLSSLHYELMRQVRLVEHLGELAEVQQKVINLKKEELDLRKLISETVKRFTPLAGEKEIELIQKLPLDRFCIEGDRDALEQVFSNLLTNALKYTERGGQITVSMRKDQDRVLVKISDTGIGIAEEDLPYIFERFYRADKSRSTNGTGIGLTISRELIEGHQGKVEVKSRKGEGSSFLIIFPLC